VLIFASLNVIQFIIGSYLDPRLTGASLAISPSPLCGAHLGLSSAAHPIAFIVYSAGTPSGKWVATLLSGGSNADMDHGPSSWISGVHRDVVKAI